MNQAKESSYFRCTTSQKLCVHQKTIYLIQISPFNAYIMNLIFSKLHNTFLSNTLLKKLAKYSKYIYDIWKLFS